MKVDPTDLMALSDIADLLGVGASAVTNWKTRLPDFPAPITTVARGKTELYLGAQVRAWAAARYGTNAVLRALQAQNPDMTVTEALALLETVPAPPPATD